MTSARAFATGFREVQLKLDQYNRLVDGRGLRWITTEVAMQAKKDLLDTAKIDAGSDLALSGWRRAPRKPVKLRAGFELKSNGQAEFVPKPNGVWKVLEAGRDSGISKKRATRGRVYGRSSGKLTWTRAWEKIGPKVPKWTEKANSELLRNCWR